MRKIYFFEKQFLLFAIVILLVFTHYFLSCELDVDDPQTTVQFDLNGGSGTTPEPKTVLKGYIVVLPTGDNLYNPPLAFYGWNSKPDGSGSDYRGGLHLSLHDNLTLYAQWSLPVITFDINGGQGTIPEPQTAEVGSQITLPLRGDLTKGGYEFGGWGTSRFESTIGYSAGTSYTVIQHTTLYAKWNTIFTVTYTSDGGTGTPPTPHHVASGSSIKLRNNTFTNDSRVFLGWYSPNVTVIGGGSSYLQPGATISNIRSNLTFTARWW